MAFTKTVTDDKIEIVTDFKQIQVRTATIVKEDGVELSRSFHRQTIDPGTIDASDNFVDRDMSGYSAEIQGIANTVWTSEVKTAWKNHLIANKPLS